MRADRIGADDNGDSGRPPATDLPDLRARYYHPPSGPAVRVQASVPGAAGRVHRAAAAVRQGLITVYVGLAANKTYELIFTKFPIAGKKRMTFIFPYIVYGIEYRPKYMHRSIENLLPSHGRVNYDPG